MASITARVNQVTNSLNEEISIVAIPSAVEPAIASDLMIQPAPPIKISKDEIRGSLQASTWDGIFATIFSTITGGVLLSNFLIELEASAWQIGLLASIPMFANLLQPVGAYLADLTTSRRIYGLWIYGISRLLWLPLSFGIILTHWHAFQPQQMILATLIVMIVSHALGALGSASWLAWLAALVPRQLRGRYFGFRNSTFSLTSLIAMPALGFGVTGWPGGSTQGFGIMLAIAVVVGLISLTCQSWMKDINPQDRFIAAKPPSILAPSPDEQVVSPEQSDRLLQNPHFWIFLLYFGLWAFSTNLSNPFFNVYLLDDLDLGLSRVTLYNGLGAGATLLMLVRWGRLADRVGNRPILLLVGTVVGLLPLLWVGTGTGSMSLWLWFPLLHLLGGGAGAAIDLCINNLQLAIAPAQHHTTYFAATAAVGGVCGALGAIAGGGLAEWVESGGIPGLFVLSSLLRLIALLPLLFWIQEPQSHSLQKTLASFQWP